MTQKIGVAFAGGGGKGGYQVGVCNALNEFGIQPAAISGTSVGALNGALYAQGRTEVAERIWRNIRQEDVLDFSLGHLLLSFAKKTAEKLAEHGLPGEPTVTRLTSVLSKMHFRKMGLFSQEGLLSMMNDAFSEQPISSLTFPFYTAAHDTTNNRVDYLRVAGRDEADARKVLLASAALPGIFDDIEIDQSIYTDGGWYWGRPDKALDNTPVMPLFNAGCSIIILVCLNRDDLLERAK